MSKALTCDSYDTLKEWLVLHYCLIYCVCCSYVLYDSTHVYWDCRWSRNLTSYDSIDELLLTTLWIFSLERNNLDVWIACLSLLCEESNSVWLVFLDTDESLVDLTTLHEEVNTDENLVSLLKHKTMVSCEIRLTLYGIDYYPFRLCTWRRTELNVSWEACTTHTYDTCCLNLINYFLRSKLRLILECHECFTTVNTLFPLISLNSNIYCWLCVAACINDSIYLEHSTANT